MKFLNDLSDGQQLIVVLVAVVVLGAVLVGLLSLLVGVIK